MYLRSTKRRNRDGSTVEYYALAENVWNADALDREVLERLVHSIRRVLIDGGIQEAAATGEPVRAADIEIERVDDLGVVHVAGALWDTLGIGDAIRKRITGKKRFLAVSRG